MDNRYFVELEGSTQSRSQDEEDGSKWTLAKAGYTLKGGHPDTT